VLERENPPTGFQSSRRNLIRIGALVASAIIAKTTSAAADGFRRDDFDQDVRAARDTAERALQQLQTAQVSRANRNRDFHCFLKGTTIRTADGDRKIEDLAAGDLLPTVFRGTQPIQWIGCYRFKKSNPEKAWVKQVRPIRIAQSALAPGMPHTDLYLTQTHAVLIDGVLVEAGNLTTGSTISRYDADELDQLEFFHVKLECHDVIYAEGAPCETLSMVDENAANFADYLRRFGAANRDQPLCAPRIYYEYTRGEIKSCFRSAISPWIDRRKTVDIIRDKLDARGAALLRESELIS
jgi:hypothetical protein